MSENPSPSTSSKCPLPCSSIAPFGPKRTVRGSTLVTSKVWVVRIATGIDPPESRLILLLESPGRISILIDWRSNSTLTGTLTDLSLWVTVIVAVPSPTALTNPWLSTVATLVLLELYAVNVDSVRVKVAPSEKTPTTLSGIGISGNLRVNDFGSTRSWVGESCRSISLQIRAG